MSKYYDAFTHVFSMLLHGEFERFWVTFSHLFLPKYFRVWKSVSGKDPRPVRAQGMSQDPIMIYQMAKVGSRSVLFSLEYSYLKHHLPNVPIHHIHNLANLEAHERRAQRTQNTEELGVIQQYKKILHDFEQTPNQHWNVISLVRDPVARNVGSFFHNLDRYLPNWKPRWQAGTLPMEEVVQAFLNTRELHLTANIWFDVEFKSVLGIDVYDTPFQTANGYQFYANPPKVDLVVIRLEDLNRVAVPVVEKFLGIRDFKLYPSNIGDEKDYADVYRAFKSTPLPFDYVANIYQTRFACHFYTDAELQSFTRKWTQPKARV
jgi:hypothetical protein